MTGVDELRSLASSARPGVLLSFTGEQLLQYLAEEANPAIFAKPALTSAGVAEVVARALGMRRVPDPKSVAKWVRSGLHGVKLVAVPAGRGYGYTQEAVQDFVEAVRASKTKRAPTSPPVFTPSGDPADEIEIYARGGRSTGRTPTSRGKAGRTHAG